MNYNLSNMPMIRSTRVFVPKSPSSSSSSVRNSNKLDRSGSLEAERRFKVDDGDWFNERVNNSFTSNKVILNQQLESVMMEFSKETQSSSSSMEQQEEESDVKISSLASSDTEFVEYMRFGNFYSRKRRKFVTGKGGMEVERGVIGKEERMFGKQFVRKQSKVRRNLELKELNSSSLVKGGELLEIGALENSSSLVKGGELMEIGALGNSSQPVKESVGGGGVYKRVVLSFVIDISTSLNSVYQFLNSVPGYMGKKNSRLRLSLPAAFMTDQTISRGFSAPAGIHLCEDSLSSSSGICRIGWSRNNVPIFCIDFSAIPLSLILHCTISLEFQRLPQCLRIYLNGNGDGNLDSGNSLKKRKVDEINAGNELCLSFPDKKRSCSKRVNINPLSTVFYSDILNSDDAFFASSDDWISSAVTNCEPKQNKREPSMMCHLNSEVDILNSDGAFFASSDDWISSAVSNCEPKQNKRKSSVTCHLNSEADLFMSGDDWTPLVLESKHKKRKVSSKDPTYDPSSELKGDVYRSMMKALAKPIHVPIVKTGLQESIPVPIVREVPYYASCDYLPFVQPGVYITMENDEVTNTLNRKVATYDADSGDEKWLGKLHNAHHGENSLSLEKFEEMIDAFEKAAFNSLNNKIDESTATALCPDTGTNLVVDVYKFWLKKRKRSFLLRVFKTAKKVQAKAPDMPVRKRRSIRKKGEHRGRGIRRHFMQEFDPEFDPVKEKEHEARRTRKEKEGEARRTRKEKEGEAHRIIKEKEGEAHRIIKEKEGEARRIRKEECVAQQEKMGTAREDDLCKSEKADILRVEQATKAAQENLEMALQKRQRAQTLMEYADLAAEWATKALKIAQATRISGSSEVAASSYLDD